MVSSLVLIGYFAPIRLSLCGSLRITSGVCMHCWVCMIDNIVLGLIFYNIWTIKCLISIFIKGLAKLIRSPVTDAARGEFEISV